VNFAHHYRASAGEFRRRAAGAPSPELGAQLLRIAAHHDRLALLEGGEPPPENPLLAPAEKPLESAVAKARRHVLQAEANVAHQQALCARLVANPRLAGLTAQARSVLSTLTHTLRLAREHLALELAEARRRSPDADAPSRERTSEVPAWRGPAKEDTT
jgi:hypothetical protein